MRKRGVLEEQACLDVLLLCTNAEIRASDEGIASIHDDALGVKARPRRARAHRTSVVVDARDWVAVGPSVLAKARDLRFAVRLSIDVSTLDLLHVDEEAHVELSLGHRLMQWAQHARASLKGEAREDDLLLRGFEELGGVTDAVQACGNGERGEATVALVVAGDSGRVTGANVSGVFAGTPIGSCIARAARAATFPRFTRPTFTLNYPFRIRSSSVVRPEPSREELRVAKRALEPLIAGCGTGANESALVQFAISSVTGRVASVEVTGLASAASRQCVERSLQRQVHFNAFDGAALQLAWRFDVP